MARWTYQVGHRTVANGIERGADFIFIPRLHSAAQIAQIIEAALRDGLQEVREEQIGQLSMRNEVLASLAPRCIKLNLRS